MPQPSANQPPAEGSLPGSRGEHALQEQHGTAKRAAGFYANQMLDHLNDAMQVFVGRMDMVFISTADAHGECDTSLRAGPVGFVQVLDDHTLAYPEYRGNGVMASLGNIQENPHVGLMFVDFFRDKIGLHVNGRARILPSQDFAELPDAPEDACTPVPLGGQRVDLWVVVEVEEAYVHCSKHIPLLRKLTSDEVVAWGTDDARAKGGDYFKAAAERRKRAA